MEMQAFVNSAVYPRLVSEEQLRNRPHYDDFRGMIEWSQFFGDSFHCFARGEKVALTEQVLGSYVQYMNETAPRMRAEVIPGYATGNDKAYANSELATHLQNAAMARMWLPIIHGGWRSRIDCLEAVTLSRRNMARLAASIYVERQELLNKWGGEWTLPNLTRGKKLIVGSLNASLVEADTAITLLPAIRAMASAKESLPFFMLSAPGQFEHSGSGKTTNPNADYLVGDLQRRDVVGLQCKSAVRDSDIEYTDKDRIVLIDGRRDLCGQRFMFSSGKEGNRVEVSWGGKIAIAAYKEYAGADDKLPLSLLDFIGLSESENEHLRHTVTREGFASYSFSDTRTRRQQLWSRIMRKIRETRSAPA